MKSLKLPPNHTYQQGQTIETVGPIVIIGANGSGKSRLGAWIDTSTTQAVPVHRVAAQRALSVPEQTILKSLDDSMNELLYGHIAGANRNKLDRWRSTPTTSLLNDYDKVLSALFAKEAKRNADYVKLAKGISEKPDIPPSPMDTLLANWRNLLPHRELDIEDAKILVKTPTGGRFHGKEMSDGERVAFYLMAQCLCAPENAILVIDEPEIHLHRSLMSKLWTGMEEARKDCLFVYITHDLEFAASRANSTKIWVKSYSDGQQWDWELVPDIDELPESILFEILGSRKKILFVEGTKDSFDYAVYQGVYPDFTVIPRGSCTTVIESTKAMRDNPLLHHVDAFGIVDQDFRTQDEIDSLSKHGVFVLAVAEIENIFCVPEVLSEVASYLQLDPANTITEAVKFVTDAITRELDSQISQRTLREINHHLSMITPKATGMQQISESVKSAVSGIDINAIYNRNEDLYKTALATGDLGEMLRIYNRKSISRTISGIFNLRDGEFVNLVLRLISSTRREVILNGLRAYVPTL